MLLVLGTVVAFLATINAQPDVDFNCTYLSPTKMKLTFTPTSVKCNDKLTAAQCKVFFVDAAVVADDDTSKRPALCYSSLKAAPIEVLVQKMATEYCPKHCGYCCLTDAYKCSDKQSPAINCQTITDSMCDDPAWRQLIADNCPSRCGFCQQVDCSADTSICNNMYLQSFVNANCKRTCNRCTTTTATTVTPVVGACSDTSTSCANWNTNGFCTSSFYTLQQKQQYCSRTCNLCTGK